MSDAVETGAATPPEEPTDVPQEPKQEPACYRLAVVVVCSNTACGKNVMVDEGGAIGAALLHQPFNVRCACGTETKVVAHPRSPRLPPGTELRRQAPEAVSIPGTPGVNRHQRRALEAQGFRRTPGGLLVKG